MQKVKTIRSNPHLAFIRTLPCCMCGYGESQAAHLRIGTGGGMGMKPGDNFTVPLCFTCHARQHREGERTFWRDIEKAKELCNGLWVKSGLTEECGLIISRFRRAHAVCN